MSIEQLEPQEIWTHFCQLNAIPRPSKREARVVAFTKAFGAQLNLQTTVDRAGNVAIEPAGMQAANRGVQSTSIWYIKNEDTPFDFDTDGIERRGRGLGQGAGHHLWCG